MHFFIPWLVKKLMKLLMQLKDKDFLLIKAILFWNKFYKRFFLWNSHRTPLYEKLWDKKRPLNVNKIRIIRAFSLFEIGKVW